MVRRGKYSGAACVVVGMDQRDGRLLIANGAEISARHPKRKNPRHLQSTNTVLEEVARRTTEGKSLDDGWLRALIATARSRSATTCV